MSIVGSGSEKSVLVDMDGVLADFDGAVLRGMPTEIPRVPRTNFYIARDYPEHKEAVADIYSEPGFFYGLEPIEGALDGWSKLAELGFHPRIASAPLTLNPRSVEGKIAWLEEYLVPKFGVAVIDEAIFDKEKFKYDASILIDDRPAVDTGNGRARWRHVVFDQPYNAAVHGGLRLHGWMDPDLGGVMARASGA